MHTLFRCWRRSAIAGLIFLAAAFQSTAADTLLWNTNKEIVTADLHSVPLLRVLESVSKAILATPVLVYTKSKGLYAGATFKAGFISRDDDANRQFYKTPFTMPELLYSNFVTPPEEVKPLMVYVTNITRGPQ